jgi:hypothetical protein
MPMRVAEKCKVWVTGSNTGIMGSIPIRGMDVRSRHSVS